MSDKNDALATVAPGGAIVSYTADQVDLIKRTVAKEATDDELKLFLAQCVRTGLDPLAKQIYFTKYKGRVTIMTAIDGLRVIAERATVRPYAGQLGPFWTSGERDGEGQVIWTDVWLEKTNPLAAKVGILREGFQVPVWGVATWETYGSNNNFWRRGGPHMLAKTAEALALRKAFPNDMGGLFTLEEMDQADAGGPPAGAPAPVEAKPALSALSEPAAAGEDAGAQHAAAEPPPEKKKRKRRTKAEMVEARAAEKAKIEAEERAAGSAPAKGTPGEPLEPELVDGDPPPDAENLESMETPSEAENMRHSFLDLTKRMDSMAHGEESHHPVTGEVDTPHGIVGDVNEFKKKYAGTVAGERFLNDLRQTYVVMVQAQSK